MRRKTDDEKIDREDDDEDETAIDIHPKAPMPGKDGCG